MANFHPPPVGGTARTDPLFVSPTPARGSAACLENECVSGRLLVWRGFRVIQCSFASGAAIVGFVRGIIARFAAMVSRKGSKEWYHGCLDVSTTTVYWQRRNRNVVLLPLTLSGPFFFMVARSMPSPDENNTWQFYGGTVANIGGDLTFNAGSLFDGGLADSSGDGGSGGAIYNYNGGVIT